MPPDAFGGYAHRRPKNLRRRRLSPINRNSVGRFLLYTAGNIYSGRLAKLFRDDRRKAKGEVGCLEILFWVNGQDYAISDLTVTSADQGPDRKTVTAKFMNIDRTEENASISSAMVGARCSTKCTRLPPPLGPYLRFLKCSQ